MWPSQRFAPRRRFRRPRPYGYRIRTRNNRARPNPLSVRAGQSRHLAAEIALGPVDAFAKRKADEAGARGRPADLAFGFLDRLCDGLLALFDGVALLKQTNFLVEGSQARLDDLLDDVGGLALRLGGEHAFLAFDGRSIEPGGITPLRFGGPPPHAR